MIGSRRHRSTRLSRRDRGSGARPPEVRVEDRGESVSKLPAPLVVGIAYAAGSVPFSQVAARLTRGVDLRQIGTGTVSGTALYGVSGFGPLAVAGVLEVGKGAVGPLLAGPDRAGLGALAGAAAVVGHNWSPWLGGAGGRGVSPAVGALLVQGWEGAAVLLGGMALARVVDEAGFGTFLADVALVPVLAWRHGRRGALAAAAVVAPMLAKRVTGNGPPDRREASWLRNRILFDADRHGDPPAVRRTAASRAA